VKQWRAQSQHLGIIRAAFPANTRLVSPKVLTVVRPGEWVVARTRDDVLAVCVTIQPVGSAFATVTLDLEEDSQPRESGS